MDKLIEFVYYWLFPIAAISGVYMIIISRIYKVYEKLDTDKVLRKLIIASVVIGLVVILWAYVTGTNWFQSVSGFTKNGVEWIGNTDFSKEATIFASGIWQRIFQFLLKWLPIYFRAFILVFVIATFVLMKSLIWRIHFNRAANIIFSTIISFPVLCCKYFGGYQTPIFDFTQSRLFTAKMKENWNDSYFRALQGVDDKGNKFDAGSGGTAQVQRVKAATLAIRRTKTKIKTAAGFRRAEIIIRNSRETDTDRLIESALRELGTRLIAPSIRFQDTPVLNVERGGYVFDSDVMYNAGDALGSWKDIFTNPFAKTSKVINGGVGAAKTTYMVLKNMVLYFLRLTPPSIYERIVSREIKLFTPDESADKAKYKVQQNIDLSVIPEPLDVETGNDIETQTEIARKVAYQRKDDVTNALNAYKISGAFHRVLVGGNTAVYQYTLPRTADLPTDFPRIQEGIASMLKTENTPVLTVSAGILSLSVLNGVNIPVDFRAMLKNRSKGMKSIISGIAGVDAMGNNIIVELGDKVPHAMLFGTTGSGKTVTIMSILYSIMSANDPSRLKIAYADGKGNSFEFMRTDNKDSVTYHPNPFTYAQPADASGDVEYARGLIQHIVKETRRRIEVFKQRGVSKLEEFNKRFPEEKMYEILLVVDEFSAITDRDHELESGEKTEDAFEYLAKMSRSVGIRMLLANQTARKEKIPGKVTANIGGRVSLRVSEPIESNIALPESGIAAHLITQPGEFYSTMNGARNAEHGNTPFLADETMYAINDSLEIKFGHHDYVISRDKVMSEFYGEEEGAYNVPDPMPTKETEIDVLLDVIKNFPEWALANKKSAVFVENKSVLSDDSLVKKRSKQAIKRALEKCENSEVKPAVI